MRTPKHEVVHPPAERLTLGERTADRIARALGSWRFLILQTSLIAAWVTFNTLSGRRVDPFPYILLNLCLSLQAAYTGPVLQMTGNRQAAKDHVRDEHEAAEVQEMFDSHQLLEKINLQQLEILRRLDARDGTATA